jgi:ribonuclease VapC
MMFVDASALTAMLTNESDAAELIARLQADTTRLTSPLVIWETVMAVSRVIGLPITEAETAVDEYLALMGITVAPVAAETRHIALSAFDRFGKGRHPAALNFGDCFAYACAWQVGEPLLYKGDDFPLTDIEAA